MVGSPPASAGDMGSIPGPGGSHMPRSDWARAPQLLSPRSRAHAPQQKKNMILLTQSKKNNNNKVRTK